MAAAALGRWADHPKIVQFVWDEASTPGASWSFVGSALGIYVAAIVVLKLLVSTFKAPVPLGPLQALHNLLLMLASAAIFTFTASATVQEHQNAANWLLPGPKLIFPGWLFCFPQDTRSAGRLFFWSYAFYLTKIYELLDTLIIVLRKRRLTLFHALQHAGNIVICFCWLRYAQSLQILFLLINTSIQTLLYAYFFATSVGFNPPVKELVTLAQIFQFAFSLAASGVLFYLVRSGASCSGVNSCAANAAFNLALMLLLINYFVKVYVKPQSKAVTGKKKRGSSRKVE